MSEKEFVQMSFWLPKKLRKKFKIKMAENEDNNQSKVIRKLIKKHYLKD